MGHTVSSRQRGFTARTPGMPTGCTRRGPLSASSDPRPRCARHCIYVYSQSVMWARPPLCEGAGPPSPPHSWLDVQPSAPAPAAAPAPASAPPPPNDSPAEECGGCGRVVRHRLPVQVRMRCCACLQSLRSLPSGVPSPAAASAPHMPIRAPPRLSGREE